MTLIGTVIYVPPKDDEAGKFVPFAGDASSTLVSALLDGTQGQTVRVFRCDETDLCLNPTFEQMSLANAKAIRPRVALLIGNMVDAIRADTAIGNAEKELLQVASVGFRSKGTMTNLPRDENRTPGKASAKERVRGQGPGAVGSASLAPLRPGAERECVRDPRTRTPRPQEHRCRRCGIERVISPAPLFAPTLPPATMKIGQEP